MNIKKYVASTNREAFKKLRSELGSDAIILSNKVIDGMVEIVAMADDEVEKISKPQAHPLHDTPSSPRINPTRITRPSQDLMPEPASSIISQPQGSPSNEIQTLMNELRSMRSMMESQLTELNWSNNQHRSPQKSLILKEMLSSGLSASLSRYLVEKLPQEVTSANGLDWIKSVLCKNLTSIASDDEILEKGGVYALVGPTGVGKTTTTAKLAARCVMKHGPSSLALISTDGYRIGGYEQLRIYGKILGVMVHAVKDESDLKIALAELQGKHTILIDTVGVSQRDKMVAEQLAMLSGTHTPVKRLLCLNATSTGETLNEVVRAYQSENLAGCIFTKLDEAATIGGVIDVAIRQKLPVYYVANGQRVPEDLHLANRQYLIDRTFKLKRETTPFKFLDEELPLLLSSFNANPAMSSHAEVTLG